MRTGFIAVAASSSGGPGTPGVVRNLAGVPEVGIVYLSWDAPFSDGGSSITGYKIQFSTDNGATWQGLQSTSSSTFSYDYSGLTNGTTYLFSVRAVNSVGDGPDQSPALSATPNFATVTGGTLTSDSTYYYRTFTSNGTLTISTTPISVDYLVVAGGQGGSGVANNLNFSTTGRGGSGSLVATGSSEKIVGSFAVTVGAGGAGGTRSTTFSVYTGVNGGSSSIAGIVERSGVNDLFTSGLSDSYESFNATRQIAGGGASAASNGLNASINSSVNTSFGGNGANGQTVWGQTYGGGGGSSSQSLTVYENSSGQPVDPAFESGTSFTYSAVAGVGGSGGGGNGGVDSSRSGNQNGQANTGGGGGGGIDLAGNDGAGGIGGSGVVVVRYLKSLVSA
jgi:hypothetical protein